MRNRRLPMGFGLLLSLGLVFFYSESSYAIEYIGEGCTTVFWRDSDCDGYVIGGKDGTNGYLWYNEPQPPFFDPDADDNDITVNTPASAQNRYGAFSNINNFKSYLQALGYNHQINNVYFISLTGNNSTGQPNNINFPYRNIPQPAGTNPPIIQAGDVVVFREGNYTNEIHTKGGTVHISGVGYRDLGFQGTVSQPVLVVNFPGERVIQRGTGPSAFGFAENTRHTIVRGFEFDGDYEQGNYAREVITFNPYVVEHVTLKDCEIRNGDRWGIFGYIFSGRNYVTLDGLVIHHIGMEHCIYRNDGADTTQTDVGWVIKNSIFHTTGGHGIHWRGGDQFVFENNIIHSTRWNGIEIKNGSTNGIIRNNLIFNAGRCPLTIYTTAEIQHQNTGINNITVVNNILAAKAGGNGVGSDTSSYPSVQINHEEPNFQMHRNLKFFNNVLLTQGNAAFHYGFAQEIAETTMENNIFYRNGQLASNQNTGMRVCGGWTDGTHSSGPNNETYCNGAYWWSFNAMMNPIQRPQFSGNIYANPLFTDVTNTYTTNLTPWEYNFDSTQNSPMIDFALSQYASTVDLKGRSRVGNPDAGAYEYSQPSGNQAPFVEAGVDQLLTAAQDTTTLSGTVTDDGLPNPPAQVFIQWTKLSGPGSVSFSNPTQAATSVTFSAEGLYRLRLSATDGALFSSDVVEVTFGSITSGGGGNGGQTASGSETQFLTCSNPQNASDRQRPPVCFRISSEGAQNNVSVKIFDTRGRLINELVNGSLPQGDYRYVWDGLDINGAPMSSGGFIAVLKADLTDKKRVVLIR